MGDMFRLSVSHHQALFFLFIKIQILDLFQMCNGIQYTYRIGSSIYCAYYCYSFIALVGYKFYNIIVILVS